MSVIDDRGVRENAVVPFEKSVKLFMNRKGREGESDKVYNLFLSLRLNESLIISGFMNFTLPFDQIYNTVRIRQL